MQIKKLARVCSMSNIATKPKILFFCSVSREVFTWGRSDYGQLGQGEVQSRSHDPGNQSQCCHEPREIPPLKGCKQVHLRNWTMLCRMIQQIVYALVPAGCVWL